MIRNRPLVQMSKKLPAKHSPERQRENWGSRLGVVMAVAGSAIGLGNFLRFPAKAAANGGGAFMIPYLIAFLLLGIPLMWIEWTLGRYGGGFGHGTAPGIFHSIWRKNRFIKYFGVIGLFGPLVIYIYYSYIESWTLAYSLFSLAGSYRGITGQGMMRAFLHGFQGVEKNGYFSGIGTAYFFFICTFILNVVVLYYGIKGGIERLCKVALPLLLSLGLILLLRVVSLGAPNVLHPEWNIANGFGFLWNPDFTALKSAKVWLEAAGQVFFTLSVGIGVILTYASYLSKGDDVALSGLTAAGTNEFAEVILGGGIIIPAAFVFFGPQATGEIAGSGVFNLGFVTMPLIINSMPWSQITGFFWFFLLFLAGITSSVSLAQPVIAFMEDEFNLDRRKAVMIFAVTAFLLCQPVIFFLKNGVVDELDFWGGTVFLVVFATIETILFSWVLGMQNAWEEIHKGADLAVPSVYKFIIKYVTPLFLFAILGMWFFQQWLPVIMMKGVPPQDKLFLLATRCVLLGIFILLASLVRTAWKRREPGKEGK
ncbi:MAG: sodium-dependent transporter [Candidatus Omnitrophota bacterium]